MIPNFNPNKWDKEKIIDYVIGEQPLTDEQLEFLNYFDKLQQENKELKEKMNFYKNNFQGYSYERYKEILDKLQELKEGKK